MKPNFALSLSFDGISLFHRTDRGWYLVGDIALDSPDFSGELDMLRKTAKALDNRGLATKLILPNDQIRYLDVKTGKVGDSKRIQGARVALDGATPYAVDDLAISASAHGAVTHVAAVAYETLKEAEAFAVEHKFNPVCFVAVPENGNYLGEPFFGLTSHAETLPDGGADIGPEAQPVRVTAGASAATQKPNQPELETISAPPDPADFTADDTQSEPEIADPTPAPSFHSSRKGHDGAGESAPKLSGVSRLTIGGGDAPAVAQSSETGEPVLPDTTLFDATDDTKAEPGPSLMTRMRSAVAPLRELADKLPRSLPVSLPRRASKQDAEPELELEPTPEPVAEPADLGISSPDPDQLQEEPDSEAQRMTVFGAREETSVGGKPRYLGLVLTILLLLFLAAVATWASVFTDDGIAGLFKRQPTAPVVATAPLTPAPDQDVDQPTGLTDAQPDTITDSAVAEADAQSTPGMLTGREAEAHYAVTGIWQKGPEQPTPAPALNNDSLYVASIDSRVSAQDAVLIPAPEHALTDTQPQSLSAPAAAGSTFEFDERGFVVATLRGAVTPDGITIYRGRPSVTPQNVPERATATADTPPATDRLASVRPRARPNGLVENSERARNGGLTLAQLGKKRPKARPATAKFELEKDQTPTAQAVAVSRKPKTRPKNFLMIVETALAQKAEQQDSGVIQAAAAAPSVRSTPRIPTTASVARQATVKNVINLRKLNLIGVYGKPSSRRALVRLSSGRYKKVKVGDRIDGGKISAIGEAELRYTKSGRNVILKMPKT